MKKIFYFSAVFIIAALSVFLWTKYARKPAGISPFACADPAKLQKESPDHWRDALAYVAGKHKSGIVLDEAIAVAGAADITDETLAALKTRKTFPLPASPAGSQIGVLDEQAFYTLPSVKAAGKKYTDAFNQLKVQYDKQVKTLSPDAKERLKAEYNQALSTYQEKLLATPLSAFEKQVKKIAEEKGLICVVKQGDVLYGGTDVTPLVREGATPSAGNRPPLTQSSVAIVNVEKLMPFHPFFPRIDELTREEQAWKQGRFGIAETLLSDAEIKKWETDRESAFADWQKEVRSLVKSDSVSSAKPSPQLDEKKLSSIKRALDSAYQAALQQKMESLNKNYEQHVRLVQSQTEQSLHRFADELVVFRNKKIAALREALARDFEARIKSQAASLSEEELAYEKQILDADQSKKLDLDLKIQVATGDQKKALQVEKALLEKREEDKKDAKLAVLRQELQTIRDRELVKSADTLQTEAAKLDAAAFERMKRYREQLVKAAEATLADQQESLKEELALYRGKAMETAKTEVTQKYGPQAARVLTMEGEQEMEAHLMSERKKIEAKLAEEERDILAHSKAYESATAAIKNGNKTIVPEVVLGLEKQKVDLLAAIKNEIAKKAGNLAKERHVQVVLSDVAVNVSALDLTGEIAKSLKQ